LDPLREDRNQGKEEDQHHQEKSEDQNQEKEDSGLGGLGADAQDPMGSPEADQEKPREDEGHEGVRASASGLDPGLRAFEGDPEAPEDRAPGVRLQVAHLTTPDTLLGSFHSPEIGLPQYYTF
jgi:hypothetical protein